MATNTNYSLTSSSIAQQVNDKRKKDEQKEIKELASLIVMLDDVIEVIASSASGQSSFGALEDLESDTLKPETETENKTNDTSSSKTATNNTLKSTSSAPTTSTPTTSTGQGYPSSEEVASALAAMAEMVNFLQLEIQQSTDQAYIMACKVMIAQINSAMNVCQTYINAYNACQQEINDYYSWAFSSYPDPLVISSEVQKQIDYYLSRTKTCVKTEVIDGMKQTIHWEEPDPDYHGLENYIKSHCPCPVYLDPHCTDPTQMLLDAGAQVQADAYSKLEPAEVLLEDELLLNTNPALREIGKMIFNDAEFSEEAIEQLEQILNSTIEAVTLISATSSSDYKSGPSNDMIIQILTIMNNNVSQLEALMAKFEQKITENDTRCSKVFSEHAKISLDKAKAEVDKIKKLIESCEKAEKAAKAMGITSEAVMILMAALTGNITLLVITVAMCVLNETGVMDEITNSIASSIAKDLEKNGVSKEKAEKDSKAIAAAVIIGVVMVATLVSGYGFSMFAEEATTEAVAQSTEEIATEAAELDSSITTAAEESQSSFSSEVINAIKQLVKELSEKIATTQKTTLLGKATELVKIASESLPSLLNKAAEISYNSLANVYEEAAAMTTTAYDSLPTLSNTVKLAIANGLEEISTTNLAQHATEADLYGKKSEKEIQKEAMRNSIIVNVAAMIAGMGIMNSMSEVKTNELFNSSSLKKLKESIGDINYIFNGLTMVNLGASFVQTAAEVDRSINLKKQGDAEKALGIDQAMLTYFLYLLDITNEHSQASMQEYQSALKSRQETDSSMLKNMLSFENEYARILAQGA